VKKFKPRQRLVTTEEVAEFFHVDPVTVRRLVSRGDLPTYRIGSEYRFRWDDIDTYLGKQRVHWTSDESAGEGGKTQRNIGLETHRSLLQDKDSFTLHMGDMTIMIYGEANQPWGQDLYTMAVVGLIQEADPVQWLKAGNDSAREQFYASVLSAVAQHFAAEFGQQKEVTVHDELQHLITYVRNAGLLAHPLSENVEDTDDE
jgi:excisionase family DNA binding protein